MKKNHISATMTCSGKKGVLELKSNVIIAICFMYQLKGGEFIEGFRCRSRVFSLQCCSVDCLLRIEFERKRGVY